MYLVFEEGGKTHSDRLTQATKDRNPRIWEKVNSRGLIYCSFQESLNDHKEFRLFVPCLSNTKRGSLLGGGLQLAKKTISSILSQGAVCQHSVTDWLPCFHKQMKVCSFNSFHLSSFTAM
jgi:hypothetical protein